MKVYVGAPLSHWRQARSVMSALKQDGHDITHDWTFGAELHYSNEQAIWNGRELVVAESMPEVAAACIAGVKACDFAFFLPLIETPMQGMYCELGAALALSKPVIAYAPWLHCHPVERPSVEAWMAHKGAFLQHPLVTLCQHLRDALNTVQVVETALTEARAFSARIKEFRRVYPDFSLN